MANVTGILEGNQVIEEQLDLHGIIAGDAVITEGGRLNLFGTVAGNVIIRRGGHAEINGTVAGYVHNFGYVRIAGVVVGELWKHADSDTVIVEKSIINGQQK